MVVDVKNKALKELLYLWRNDDLNWTKERKEKWKTIPKSYKSLHSKSELEGLRKYFLSGVYDQYIPPLTTFLTTPFETEEDVLKVFNSEFFCADNRQSIINGFLEEFWKVYPEDENMYERIQSALLGKSWIKRIEKDKNGKRDVLVSVDPNSFVAKFLNHAKLTLVQKRDEAFSPYLNRLDYFYSCLENADDAGRLSKSKLDFIFGVIEKLKDYPKATKSSLELAAWLEQEKDKMYEKWPFKE